MKTKKWAIGLIILTTILISLAQPFFKIGAENLPEIFTNWTLFIGILIYAIATISLMYAFKGGDVTVLYPIIATGYIWVSLIAIFIFNESMPPLKWIGVTAIFAGIILITRRGSND